MGAYKTFCQNEPNMCPVFIEFHNLKGTNSPLTSVQFSCECCVRLPGLQSYVPNAL